MATLSSIRSPGVYVQEVASGPRPIQGVGTAVAAFVGVTADGPYDQAVKVVNWSQFLRTFGSFVQGANLPYAVHQFFDNGGGAAYVVRVGAIGSDEGQRATAELTSSVRAGHAVYRVEALDAGSGGDAITVAVEPKVAVEGEGEAPPDEAYTLVVRRGEDVERFENVTSRKGAANILTAVAESRLVRLTEVGSSSVAERVPASGQVALTGGAALPARVTPNDYLGDVTARSGIAGLDVLDDVTIVCVPDLAAAYEEGQIDADGFKAVQSAMISHCEARKDRMAILDTPRGLNAQQVHEWVTEKMAFSSAFAVTYFPWLSMWDPVLGRARLFPPSGALAGVWSRNDDTRGVHKAPANEVVLGALDVEYALTRREHDDLNPAGINAIRAFPGRGIVVWGGRTLSSDAQWRYVNVRRLFNYIESSILLGTQWSVFEPNDPKLWQRIERSVGAFLLGLWRDGALFGNTPAEAYYVKCDAETNPPDQVDAGYVVIEVGIAPVKPAEFVVFRISQLPTGGAVAE
ncbi:phage tail sheath family protein [Cellulomonas sp. S1-8]|uniref:phage tail sheath family protein n=1 Tax=Cellulomonas sp. S1-8 TaxID=2904790 RepID=UPI002244D507|nr:phage tail sheath C-terminal domain-containing protein [Cellulomonas sp. S1-8]UZN02556.1 phage tail sheath subtilisin-like domain-containing protein [Cellulomonas sp. S1-8]